MQIFKANFRPDGGILQKSLFFEGFVKVFKEFFRVGFREEGGRRQKLFNFF